MPPMHAAELTCMEDFLQALLLGGGRWVGGGGDKEKCGGCPHVEKGPHSIKFLHNSSPT